MIENTKALPELMCPSTALPLSESVTVSPVATSMRPEGPAIMPRVYEPPEVVPGPSAP